MPVLKYRLFGLVSSANVKNIGFLNVYEYSRNPQSYKIKDFDMLSEHVVFLNHFKQKSNYLKLKINITHFSEFKRYI